MKVLYEMKDVRVVRGRTIAEALEACYGKRLHLRPYVTDQEFDELLHKPLRKWDGEESVYRETLAVFSVGREMLEHEFRKLLAEKGYGVASTSETLACLRALKDGGIKIDHVLHLGTILRSEDYAAEYRLLTMASGETQKLPHFWNVTTLKPYYHAVAARVPTPTKPK